jgi:hypothetical protein
LKDHLLRCLRSYWIVPFFILPGADLLAQSISGDITDEHNQPIPFAHVFINELETGASADSKGHYFLTINPGTYNVVVSSVGYKSKSTRITVPDKPMTLNFTLESSAIELNEIVVKSSRKDPAYEIIQRAIDNKQKYLKLVKSSRTKIYARAMETMEKKKKKVVEQESTETDDKKGPPVDPFEQKKKEEAARLQSINLVEMNLTLNYQYPELYKEERTGFKQYGSREGLFIPVFSQADFNFYHNLVDLKGISEIPVISPLSRTSVLSYKFKLEEATKEGAELVYKIKVTPRKTGDATVSGYIFINDSTWNINRLDLTLEKGGLKFYDHFTIKQRYQKIDEELWIPSRQEFDYQTKAGKKTFKGNTVLFYSEYERDYKFPENFFGNEVAVTTNDAYKRDSTYWAESRPEPLTGDQKKMVHYRDSVDAVQKSKPYLDSMEAKYNKITLGEVLYSGIGFRKHEKKREININPLLGTLDFAVIGGFRLGTNVSWFRRYENERMIWTSAHFNMGLKNADPQGGVSFWTRYNPYKLGDFSIRIGREFYSVNSFDAYLNQLRISNYIVHDYVKTFHRIELFNGFYISSDLNFSNRKSVEEYDRTSILNPIIDETDPLYFEDYQALISNMRLAYTPGQKYMREPKRKVVLGSKYPTIFFNHQKGWKDIFASDVDFDYIDFGFEQNLLLGTLGNSKYQIKAGKFVNTNDLRYIDFKRFRQSDPILYSDPMNSFQLLDTSLTARDWFIEAHYIHHFNGAMINNIPLIKKLRLRTVAGAGIMWIKESNYRHEELFAGLERIFKLGARRRLRIGVYGVLGQSNYTPPKTDFKISFDIIDTWKRDWSY